MTLHLAFLEHIILRSAACLVPAPQRAEWFAEWRSELCYVNRSPTAFCLGAFLDACWLRRNSPTPNARPAFGLESPARCLLVLAFLAAASLIFAFRLPFARDLLLPSPYRDPANLVMISADGRFGAQKPTVSMAHYASLANLRRVVFTDLAAYQPIQARVETAEISVALASRNLFDLLQVPISALPPDPALILSNGAWHKYFHADPAIAGRPILLAGRSARVAGVLPENGWRLPGRMDAWLLVDELPPCSKGFVVGRIRAPAGERWRVSVPNGESSPMRFECASLDRDYFILASLWNIPLSLLILSATTSLALGEYPANQHSRRRIFFVIKIALVLVSAFCGSLALASVTSEGLYPTVWLVGLVVGLRWAVIDQRQRCPVCLRLLSNPTRIGGASHAFLEWYGTELICGEGHGLLYVPEIPTSCYSTQRWQYLDPSWSSLFS
jgi:hypothetical protein